MQDKSRTKVHVMWLLHLTNFDESRGKCWGAAVLVFLYRELYRNVDASRSAMGGCCLLLQSWAWFRMPFLSPQRRQSVAYTFPLVQRWSEPLTHHDLPNNQKEYRLVLDKLRHDQFVRRPYASEDIQQITPPEILRDQQVWISVVPLINYEILVWHATDRVLRQFGYVQNIPLPTPQNMDQFHHLTRQGKTEVDWSFYHADWIAFWDNRFARNPPLLRPIMEGGDSVDFNYFQWYGVNGKHHILTQDEREEELPQPPQNRPRGTRRAS